MRPIEVRYAVYPVAMAPNEAGIAVEEYVIASDMGAGRSKIPRGEDLEPYIVHWWLAKTVRKPQWGLHL